MSNGEVTFIIERFDPEKDTAPYPQEYKVILEPGQTLLNCLNNIKWTQDQTLAYRYSCGSAICGSCAMRINGKAVLACKTQVSDCVKDGVIRLAPIGNTKVVRDLVVDLEPFWNALKRVRPYLTPDSQDAPEKEREQTAEEFSKIDPSTTCIMCGACYSDCNVLEVDNQFLGPVALAKAHRFIFDSRDGGGHQRLTEISETNGIWDCTHCGECTTRCPTETKPLSRIEEIKVKAMAEGHHGNAGARHVLGFRETVGRRGLLDENYLPLRTVGFFNIPGLLSIMPVGLRMMWRGKNPPMIPHYVDKVGEVNNIFARFEEFRK